MSSKDKHTKGRTKADGPKNLLRSPRRLQVLISLGDVRIATLKGQFEVVSRSAEKWVKNGYQVKTEVLEWNDDNG